MMDNSIDVDREVIKGIVDIARNKEFYGHIIQQFERVFVGDDHPVETAAVGRIPGDRFIKMYLNRKLFHNLFKEHGKQKGWTYMLGVLEHEILHIVLGHLFIKFQDKTRGNVAMDLSVNCIIPDGGLPGKYLTPEMYGFERKKSSFWYYTHLQNNDTYQKQCANGEFGVGGVLSHVMSSHKMWDDVSDDVVAKEFAKDIIRKAKELCNKNFGNIPGEVLAQIEELLKGEKAIVPWAKVLRMFVASCAESALDYTVKRVSRRFGTRPGTRKEDVLRVAVAIDTSGSISDEQIKTFFNEVRWIWKNGVQVVVYEADCQVCAVYPFKGKFTGKVHGRGGTDLEPVLKEVENEKFDALIYFTDFYAPKIEKRYRIPTLWVLHSDMDRAQYPVKWGRYIKIDSGKAVAA
jgi:predicted metal-dependent peptidase